MRGWRKRAREGCGVKDGKVSVALGVRALWHQASQSLWLSPLLQVYLLSLSSSVLQPCFLRFLTTFSFAASLPLPGNPSLFVMLSEASLLVSLSFQAGYCLCPVSSPRWLRRTLPRCLCVLPPLKRPALSWPALCLPDLCVCNARPFLWVRVNEWWTDR